VWGGVLAVSGGSPSPDQQPLPLPQTDKQHSQERPPPHTAPPPPHPRPRKRTHFQYCTSTCAPRMYVASLAVAPSASAASARTRQKRVGRRSADSRTSTTPSWTGWRAARPATACAWLTTSLDCRLRQGLAGGGVGGRGCGVFWKVCFWLSKRLDRLLSADSQQLLPKTQSPTRRRRTHVLQLPPPHLQRLRDAHVRQPVQSGVQSDPQRRNPHQLRL